MKVHSLSSNSWVRGSLNKVTETSLFSGTGHITIPLSGLFNVGSHSSGSVATRRLLRHHTMLTLFGVLRRKLKLIRRLKCQRQIKMSIYCSYHLGVVSRVIWWYETVNWNLAARLFTRCNRFHTKLILHFTLPWLGTKSAWTANKKKTYVNELPLMEKQVKVGLVRFPNPVCLFFTLIKSLT